jgi:hypothetical protein
MSNEAFRISFQKRLLLNVMGNKSYCACGDEIDILGNHFLCCPTIRIRNKVRNPMHAKLCKAMRNIIRSEGKDADYIVEQREPLMREFFRVLEEVPTQINEDYFDEQQELGVDIIERRNAQHMNVARRADIEVVNTNINKTTLIDATWACPNATYVGNYTMGKAAQLAETRIAAAYNKYFDVKSNLDCEILFFAVETTGVLGSQAIKFLKQMVDKNEDYSHRISRIYQMVSVACTTAVAASIVFARSYLAHERVLAIPFGNFRQASEIIPNPSQFISTMRNKDEMVSSAFNNAVMVFPKRSQ